jgi:Zn-dependent M16 (insulinase) family peptidase
LGILFQQLVFFRDPNSDKTLEVFNDAIKWVVDDKFLPEDIDEAKLSVFQQVNNYSKF